ncbi:hypothetical protein KY284_020017 [Solanum tuberosum]|nr:hypothetical protein KY284_020017 [Solanum tuberosum]
MQDYISIQPPMSMSETLLVADGVPKPNDKEYRSVLGSFKGSLITLFFYYSLHGIRAITVDWLVGVELLNQSNYKVWKKCMESYLVGEDLWDVVNGSNTSSPVDELENNRAYKKWKQINVKVEFILKRTISSDLFDHIIKCKSAHDIWRTLNRLFNNKNEAQLQILQNELANTTQGIHSIAEYFLKIKNLCSEISLYLEEAISEARMRRIVIRGLKPEYIPFVTSIQGFAQQPSLEEFEIFLSSQEFLAKQLASVFVKEVEENALIANKRNFKEKERDMPHSRS